MSIPTMGENKGFMWERTQWKLPTSVDVLVKSIHVDEPGETCEVLSTYLCQHDTSADRQGCYS